MEYSIAVSFALLAAFLFLLATGWVGASVYRWLDDYERPVRNPVVESVVGVVERLGQKTYTDPEYRLLVCVYTLLLLFAAPLVGGLFVAFKLYYATPAVLLAVLAAFVARSAVRKKKLIEKEDNNAHS